jgi:hypothetical protein
MTDTRRPAPAGAGRRVQPRLDESLTGSVSHEMSTSDLSAAMLGRHRIGTVAGFRLESLADFVGIHTRDEKPAVSRPGIRSIAAMVFGHKAACSSTLEPNL